MIITKETKLITICFINKVINIDAIETANTVLKKSCKIKVPFLN